MKRLSAIIIKFIFVSLTIFGMIICCSENTSSNGDQEYLFKATFINDWLPSEAGQAIIFISDDDGSVLSEKTWTGNASFEMFPDSNLAENITNNLTHINITTVTQGTITTNLHIPVGSSWTFKGYPMVKYMEPFSVDLTFENVPDYEDYSVISSKWNSLASRSQIFGSPLNFNIYENPVDIYLKLNTVNSGVRYQWLRDVASGSRQEDLSNMNSAMSETISLPSENNGYRKYLYGIPNSGHRYEGYYRLDYGFDYNTANSVDFYYPSDSFTDYRTSIALFEEVGLTEYYQSMYGEIPNNLSKIGAEFEFVSTSFDNFEISTSGEYIQSASFWQYDDYSFAWNVYAEESITRYKLPLLPNSVTEFFDIERDEFELWVVDIIDYPEISSNSDVIKILFNSPDYFYDVVNEMRRYTKYNPEDGLMKRGNNKVTQQRFPRESYINY